MNDSQIDLFAVGVFGLIGNHERSLIILLKFIPRKMAWIGRFVFFQNVFIVFNFSRVLGEKKMFFMANGALLFCVYTVKAV